MRTIFYAVLTIILFLTNGYITKGAALPALPPAADTLPVRGFAIAAPRHEGVDSFVTFIQKELTPRKVNTLILRVDYDYQFKSHPELADSFALSEADAKKIVAACKQAGIHLVPQINLLGHQSWASHTNKLLEVYPQFDETPWVKMPVNYVWPNPEKLYCKSYCPLYPGLHKIIFALIDEIVDVFETDAFHAGMDEVFYIGESKCPRCGGRDPSELFAGEVTRISNHLTDEGHKLWIWGDRLLDGKTTGLGEWEASKNNTYRAIDMIPKEVMICDWHYERADQTAVYFATKGLNVVTCSFNNPEAAVAQVEDMYKFRQQSTPEMKDRFQGVIETIWSPADTFLKQYYNAKAPVTGEEKNAAECFRKVFLAINQHK